MGREDGEEEAEASRQGRGVGGKLPARSLRRPPRTPYDRPLARSKEGWISKIADPASRLATRFFPSLFAKPSVDHSCPGNEDDCEPKEDDDCNVPSDNSNSHISTPSEQGNKDEADAPVIHSNDIERAGNNSTSSYDNGGILEIEQFLKEKTFSRDEFSRLTELLRSRTADLSHSDPLLKKDLDVGPVAADAANKSFIQQEPRLLQESRQRWLYDRTERTPNPHMQSSSPGETSSSPVEIAKAFMGARTLGSVPSFQNVSLKDERIPSHDVHSKLPLLSSSKESPICWPGATIQHVPAFVTPQAQRGRIGLHNLPRTPYSRPLSRGAVGRPFNLLSTNSRIQQTPLYGSAQPMKRSNFVGEGGSATVGPIRRKRQKSVEAASRGTDLSHTVGSAVSPLLTSNVFWPSFSSFKENELSVDSRSSPMFSNMNRKTEKSTTAISTVHPQSSEVARKILEHLDRTVPSPKEKSAELALVLGKRNSSVKSCLDNPKGLPMENGGLEKGTLGGSIPANLVRGEVWSKNVSTSGASTSKVASVYLGSGIDQKSAEGSKEVCDSQNSAHEDDGRKFSDKNHLSSYRNQNSVHQIQKPLVSETKPALTSITVTKPDRMQGMASKHAFTFPVPSNSSGAAISEPPTPIMGPAFSRTIPSQPNEESTIPSFSFASSSTNKSLVFSFPSIGSPNTIDSSVPKFSFGSDNNRRVCFRLVGKDAVCC